MSDHSEWIKAAGQLTENPHLQILCPSCGLAFLNVEDEKVDASHIDRHMRCSNCGAHETILQRLDSSDAAETK